MIQSPLNYTGGKYRLLPQILPLFPEKIENFVDIFCGGCNVGVNVAAETHLYNDNNAALIGLCSLMKKLSSDQLIDKIEEIIRKYSLSDVSKYGYGAYGCTSGEGLSKYNREGFLRLRNDVNKMPERDDDYYTALFALVIYAFNNQLRFNRNGEYNLPPGKRDFNQKMRNKLVAFQKRLREQDSTFSNQDFTETDVSSLGQRDFVYADPPYLITCAAYNEQGGWTENDERRLLTFLDGLHERGIRFALSNVTEAKGKRNEILLEWAGAHDDYKTVELKYSYSNSNYHRGSKDSSTKEVLIINY